MEYSIIDERFVVQYADQHEGVNELYGMQNKLIAIFAEMQYKIIGRSYMEQCSNQHESVYEPCQKQSGIKSVLRISENIVRRDSN